MRKKSFITFITIIFYMLSIFASTVFAVECLHNEGTEEDDTDEVKYQPIDSTQHYVIYEICDVCATCGEDPKNYRWEEINEDTERESHNFESGICVACGYKNAEAEKQPEKEKTCEHTDLSKRTSVIIKTEAKIIDGNNEKHNVITTTQQKCTMDNCGAMVDQQQETSSEELHSFDANGKCSACGYQKIEECKHEKIKTINSNPEYQKIDSDDENHKVITTIQQKCENEKCNQIVGETTKEEVNAHDFDGDTCKDCGYIKVESKSELAEAIEFLKTNNIMVGDENGDFRANDDMTRAEFAKIVSNYVGDDAEVIYHDGMEFVDVSENHWAYDYITNVSKSGLLIGYGDGRFGCDDTLTEEQAITVICRMLRNKYDNVEFVETDAKDRGGYSEGYILIAEEEKIVIEELNRTLPASRAKVAKWLYRLYNVNKAV